MSKKLRTTASIDIDVKLNAAIGEAQKQFNALGQIIEKNLMPLNQKTAAQELVDGFKRVKEEIDKLSLDGKLPINSIDTMDKKLESVVTSMRTMKDLMSKMQGLDLSAAARELPDLFAQTKKIHTLIDNFTALEKSSAKNFSAQNASFEKMVSSQARVNALLEERKRLQQQINTANVTDDERSAFSKAKPTKIQPVDAKIKADMQANLSLLQKNKEQAELYAKAMKEVGANLGTSEVASKGQIQLKMMGSAKNAGKEMSVIAAEADKMYNSIKRMETLKASSDVIKEYSQYTEAQYKTRVTDKMNAAGPLQAQAIEVNNLMQEYRALELVTKDYVGSLRQLTLADLSTPDLIKNLQIGFNVAEEEARGFAATLQKVMQNSDLTGADSIKGIDKAIKTQIASLKKLEDQEKSYASQERIYGKGSEYAQLGQRIKNTDDALKKLIIVEKELGATSKKDYGQAQGFSDYDELTSILERQKAKVTDLKNTMTSSFSVIEEAMRGLGIDVSELSTVDKYSEKIALMRTLLDTHDQSAFDEYGQDILRLLPQMDLLDKRIEELQKQAGQQMNFKTNLDQRIREIDEVQSRMVHFFSISNTIELFKRAVRGAFDTVKELDAVMTESAVVTDFSVGDMWDQLPEYTTRANALGVSIKGAYESVTLFLQQGLEMNEAVGISNETLKMARVASMDAGLATEFMTAALRGFNMELNETSAQKVNDVYSELAKITAADNEAIATAMTKTASIAKAANMEFESTAAILAQIIETTQEAPEAA